MKNLEKEYKEQISHEAPDLWSRIEAGIDAYEAGKSTQDIVNATAPVTETSTDNITPIRKKNVIAIITRITAVAACVLILAATVKVTQRTKSESAAPAADASYSESAAPSPSPADTQYEDSMAEATEPMPETEAEDIIAPSKDASVKEEADKNSSPSLSPSESSVIKDPVAFDDARDDLLPALEEIGFKLIKDFVLEDDSTDQALLAENTINDDIDFHVASFTDTKTSDKYYVVYTINDEDKAEILIVKKADNTGDILYTNPSLNK